MARWAECLWHRWLFHPCRPRRRCQPFFQSRCAYPAWRRLPEWSAAGRGCIRAVRRSVRSATCRRESDARPAIRRKRTGRNPGRDRPSKSIADWSKLAGAGGAACASAAPHVSSAAKTTIELRNRIEPTSDVDTHGHMRDPLTGAGLAPYSAARIPGTCGQATRTSPAQWHSTLRFHEKDTRSGLLIGLGVRGDSLSG